MKKPGLPKSPLALLTLPIAGTVLLGGAGWANATGHRGADDADLLSYHSSVTTRSQDDSGSSEAEEDLALSRLTKIDLTQAASAGARAVRGGTANGRRARQQRGRQRRLYRRRGRPTAQTEVVIDAGNGQVLAKNTEHQDSRADRRESTHDHAKSDTPRVPMHHSSLPAGPSHPSSAA